MDGALICLENESGLLVWRHLPARWGPICLFGAKCEWIPIGEVVCGADVTSSRWTPDEEMRGEKK